MRITRDILLKIARDTVDRRVHQNHSIIAVYLSGSLLEEEYQLGGTVDIDLFFIHTDEIEQKREIVPLTDDIHLDIAHHSYKDYQQPRNLRVHPWLGPILNNAVIMHDPQHFLDFTQASVRGQFDRADYVLERSQVQLEQSRQIWFKLKSVESEPGLIEISLYVKAITLIANAIVSIINSPLTERRFLLQFSNRAEELGYPGLYPGLLGLLGAPNINHKKLPEWLRNWQAAYLAIPDTKRPTRLHQERYRYYKCAFDYLLETEGPESILYPLLRTWILSSMYLPEENELTNKCNEALIELGLMGAGYEERIQALDAYLDVVEEIVENWAKANGVWSS